MIEALSSTSYIVIDLPPKIQHLISGRSIRSWSYELMSSILDTIEDLAIVA